jgi:hypothetical protein
VRLRNVTFPTWLQNHRDKAPEERWLRELYPWPVFAQADCDSEKVGRRQVISHDGADYDVTLESVRWQPQHGTFRYRVFVESDGLGWHSRSFSDRFDLCGTPDGAFVTLFHTKTQEPLEKIAKAFFGRQWAEIQPDLFRTLAVSRFLAACLVGGIAEAVFRDDALTHYPEARLVGGAAPMFASGTDLWIGYRFFSEDAYAWARSATGSASRVVALYLADTKYQFRTDLARGVQVLSIAQLDASALGGRHDELIRVLLRGLELPSRALSSERLTRIVTGGEPAPAAAIGEADVHEALAAMKGPCTSKSELRYQLAAAVVLNAWIEDERRLGFVSRKKFYAFKERVGELLKWARDASLPGVELWAEAQVPAKGPIVYLRLDDVDFSFQAIPGAAILVRPDGEGLTWSGVRLKPIAPFVLSWARALRDPS